jgi:predicted nucleic acid-binding Zn ribbon protein
MADERKTGAQIAREALEKARKSSAAARLESERTAAGRRRAQIRSANLAEARERTQDQASADRGDPMPFGAAISRLMADRGWTDEAKIARVTGDWPSIVGPEIADHCQAVSLREGVLTIEAESTAWATQVQFLTRKVLARIAESVGRDVVTKLIVRGPTGPSWRHGRLRVPGQGPRDTYG